MQLSDQSMVYHIRFISSGSSFWMNFMAVCWRMRVMATTIRHPLEMIQGSMSFLDLLKVTPLRSCALDTRPIDAIRVAVTKISLKLKWKTVD